MKVKITYSKHAAERMRERGITKGEVAKAVKRPNHCVNEGTTLNCVGKKVTVVIERQIWPGAAPFVVTVFHN